MSMIYCPECSSKISDKAKVCPCCGYAGDDESMAISLQGSTEIVCPETAMTFMPRSGQMLASLCPNDEKALLRYVSDGERFATLFPSIAENVKQLTSSETQYVAKLTPQIRKLIAEGDLKFQYDKNGELLAVLKDDTKSTYKKQLRLEEVDLFPDASQSINNLTTMAMMNQILAKMQDIEKALADVHAEIRDDRLALADAARDKLLQAQSIKDPRLKDQAVLLALNGATEAKAALQRSFSRNLDRVLEEYGKHQWERMLPKAGIEARKAANEAFEDLAALTCSVQVECIGWSMLGEYDASRTALMQFGDFIRRKRLDSRDTFLKLNGASDKNRKEMVENFSSVSKAIGEFHKEHKNSQPKALPPEKKTEQKKCLEKGASDD